MAGHAFFQILFPQRLVQAQLTLVQSQQAFLQAQRLCQASEVAEQAEVCMPIPCCYAIA